MDGQIKIGAFTMVFVLRHKWEKEEYPLQNFGMWEGYKLGLWYQKNKCVGRKDFKKVREWSKNLKNSHTIGFDFLVIKFWITFDFGVMHLGVKQHL